MDHPKSTGVVAVERSRNTKVGDCSATYVSQASCPADCALRNAGCYAEYGHVGLVTNRVNAEEQINALVLAKREAKAIRALSGERPLRLHVVGDCRTDAAARTVAAACGEYTTRYGSPVWGYTHAWRDVPADAWGPVSVLASCERPEQIQAARDRGYATAIVVDRHVSDKRYTVDGERVIPCPQQTRGVSCAECRLCWDAGRLKRDRVSIAFEAHGVQASKVRNVIEGE